MQVNRFKEYSEKPWKRYKSDNTAEKSLYEKMEDLLNNNSISQDEFDTFEEMYNSYINRKP